MFIADMKDFLAHLAPGPLETIGTFMDPMRDAWARVSEMSEKLWVPANGDMGKVIPVADGQREIVLPKIQIHLDLRSVNDIDSDRLPAHLVARETQFIQMMNSSQFKGRLQIAYFGDWSFRNGTSHFSFSRICSGVKEFK